MEAKKNKRTIIKYFLWAFGVIVFLAAVAVAVMVALALYKPEGYVSAKGGNESLRADSENEQVSEYLTHYLAPNVHNNIQFDKPFEVIVPQKELNEIIAEEDLLGWKWPVEYSKVSFSTPSVHFMPNTIYLMDSVDVFGFEILLTICANPVIDEAGLLRLNLQYVRAGALDISLLAKSLTKKIVEDQLADVEDNYWLEDIRGAFLENSPFEPVFPTIYDRYIKLVRSEISEGKLVLVFEPGLSKETPGEAELVQDHQE